jgi:hypothetical protein
MVLILLAAPCFAQHWEPLDTTRHEAKLAEYIGYGWSDDEIIAGLRRWFGWTFEVSPGGRDVMIIWRRPDGTVYYLQKIGTLPPR